MVKAKDQNLQERYQGADFSTRLNLFLECPELRPRFMEIEQEESDRMLAMPKKRKTGSCLFLSFCLGIFKKATPV